MEEAAAHDDRRPSIFETAGGDQGMRRLAEAWHARVLADPVVSHAFSHGFRRDHTERLAAYWAEALGGPPTYSARYGDETSVVRLHSGNGEHDEMDRRAIACFDQALEAAGLAQDGGSRKHFTTISRGPRPARWLAIRSRRTTCPTAWTSAAGPGTGRRSPSPAMPPA